MDTTFILDGDFLGGGVNTENVFGVPIGIRRHDLGYGACVDFSWGCGYPQRVPRAHAPRSRPGLSRKRHGERE